jgi:O-antigen/teichoic acid export membrane protein
VDPLTNPAFIIFSSLSPLLIAFVKQSGWSRQVNALIALACYVVVGILGMLLSGEALTLENAIQLIAVATVIGSAAYGLVWNNLGSEEQSLDERITDATSVVK